MTHKNKRYSKLDDVSDSDEFVGCNLSQAEPGTAIFANKTGLKFTRCNLARAVVPADSVIVDCNTSQAPIPPESEPVVMVEIPKGEYDRLKAMEVNRG